MSSFIAAGTAYATHGVADDPVLHLLLDVRLPADRRPDLGRRPTCAARGFLLGGTAGRTTLNGEGLQHEDGHSHVLASTVPNLRRLRPGVRLRAGGHHPGRHPAHVRASSEDIFYYITLYNENYAMPPMPEGVERGHPQGLYKLRRPASAAGAEGTRSTCSAAAPILREALRGAGDARRAVRRRRRRLERDQLQGAAPRRAGRASAGTCCTRPRSRGVATSSECSARTHRASFVARQRLHEVAAGDDRRWVPGGCTRWAPTASAAAKRAGAARALRGRRRVHRARGARRAGAGRADRREGGRAGDQGRSGSTRRRSTRCGRDERKRLATRCLSTNESSCPSWARTSPPAMSSAILVERRRHASPKDQAVARARDRQGDGRGARRTSPARSARCKVKQGDEGQGRAGGPDGRRRGAEAAAEAAGRGEGRASRDSRRSRAAPMAGRRDRSCRPRSATSEDRRRTRRARRTERGARRGEPAAQTSRRPHAAGRGAAEPKRGEVVDISRGARRRSRRSAAGRRAPRRARGACGAVRAAAGARAGRRHPPGPRQRPAAAASARGRPGVRQRCARRRGGGGAGAGAAAPPLPDFTKWGPVERKPLTQHPPQDRRADEPGLDTRSRTSRSTTWPTSPTSRRSASSAPQAEQAGGKLT